MHSVYMHSVYIYNSILSLNFVHIIHISIFIFPSNYYECSFCSMLRSSGGQVD